MATEKFGKTFTHSLFEIFFLIILHGKNNTERIIGKKIRLGDKGGKKVKSKKKKKQQNKDNRNGTRKGIQATITN